MIHTPYKPITADMIGPIRNQFFMMAQEWVKKVHPIYVKLNHTWAWQEGVPSPDDLTATVLSLASYITPTENGHITCGTGGIELQVTNYNGSVDLRLSYVPHCMSRGLER